MPAESPISVQLVDCVAQSLAEDSAYERPEANTQTKAWLARGDALAVTWGVCNKFPETFSDCSGGALRVVKTNPVGSGGKSWSAICVVSDASGRLFMRGVKGTTLSTAVSNSLFDLNSRHGGDMAAAMVAADPPVAIHPREPGAGTVAAVLAKAASDWLHLARPRLEMVATGGLFPGRRMAFSGFLWEASGRLLLLWQTLGSLASQGRGCLRLVGGQRGSCSRRCRSKPRLGQR